MGHRDLRSPRNMAPGWRQNKKGAQGDSIPLGQQTSSAQEGTRSLSMVQESY